jgi:mutator protein MutT
MSNSGSESVLEVAIALVRRNGCLLITRRRAGTHLGGLWELPGGKCLPGESPEACAERELLEEVGAACRAVGRRAMIEYAYPEHSVRLHPIDCLYLGGALRPLQVAEWAWVTPAQLSNYEFPPANRNLIEELQREALAGIGRFASTVD